MEPFRVHWLDPRTITHVLSGDQRRALESETDYPTVQSVEGGLWDRQITPISHSSLYRALHAHFLEGQSWEDTDYADVCKRENQARREAGLEPRHEISTDTDRNVRYAYLDGLYDDLSSRSPVTRVAFERNHGEITVAVDRDGAFILLEGRHLFAIARLAGLETVPVSIRLRHECWQACRDWAVRTGYDEMMREHPDLTGLTSALALE